MAFKFSLFSLEKTEKKCDCNSNSESETMRKKSKKVKKHQKDFTKAVQKCHSKTKSKESFGSCMKKELKKWKEKRKYFNVLFLENLLKN